MKYGKLFLLVVSVVLIAGCGGRYQTYKLIEGEVSEERFENNTAQNSTEEGKHEHEMEVTRYVLVDRLTGKLFYFNELQGEINICDPKRME